MNINAIVRNGYLWDDTLPTSLDIVKGRESWLEWLENHKKVRFDFGFRSYSAFKDVNGLWVAQKRVNSKLRQKRLGNSQTFSKMSPESLYDVAAELTSDTYYQDKQSNNPEYLKHLINKRDDEIISLKTELYKLKQELETLKQKSTFCPTSSQESYNKTDSKKLLRLSNLVSKYRTRSKGTRDWTQANRLLLSLSKILEETNSD